MDVLLVNPANRLTDQITEHLGISSLKAFLGAKGFSADTLDMAIEGLSVSEAVQRILEDQPKILGISMLDDSKDNAFLLIKDVRRGGYDGAIVVGGYFPTFASKEILRDFPDIAYVVRGEGELTIAELAAELLKTENMDLSKIKGLSYRRDGTVVENEPRPLIHDLDILAPIDRKYAPQILAKGGCLRVYATRGCWGSCSFCDIVGMYGTSKGKVWRRRSVTNLVDEIEQLVQTYGTNHFIFNDEQFLIKGKKALPLVEELANEIARRKLDIEFDLMCRADTVSKPVMLKLKQAGLKDVFLGLESFDKNQLQRYNKKINVHRNIKAVIVLYRLKIDVIASVILADAYTTLGDLLVQFYVLFRMRNRYFNSKHCQISINKKLEIYRGSAVYHEYKSKGLLTKDHYLTGCDFKLKFWTDARLKLFTLEELIARLIKKPVLLLSEMILRFRYRIANLKSKVA